MNTPVGGRIFIGRRRFWYRFSVLNRAGDDGRCLEGWAASPENGHFLPKRQNAVRGYTVPLGYVKTYPDPSKFSLNPKVQYNPGLKDKLAIFGPPAAKTYGKMVPITILP
eukprot:SAG11_NODE_5589_length_1515_cov_3.557910_1_plen_110_part_00